MKRKLLIFNMIFLLLLCVSGCNKVNRKKDLNLGQSIRDAETENISTDLEMYLSLSDSMFTLINEVKDENITKEEKRDKANLIYLKYMADIDEFLSVRIRDDLGSLASSSELYLTYIALLQTYCETYQEDKEKLVQELDITDPEFDQMRSVQALAMVESFYLGLIEE